MIVGKIAATFANTRLAGFFVGGRKVGMMRKLIVIVGMICVTVFCGKILCFAEESVTIEQLYAKVLGNFGKIKDLKMKVFVQEVGLKNLRATLPKEYDVNPFYEGDMQDFWYKVPDLRMWMKDGVRGSILKGNKVIDRKFKDGSIREEEGRPQDFTINPADPTFYPNLIDYLKKYEVVKIIENPNPDVYVIKADPLPGFQNMENEQGMYLEIRINIITGVVERMIFRAPSIGDKITRIIDWQDIKEIQGIYWPQKINMYTNYYYENKPDHPLKDVSDILMLMSDIQINTGIKEDDFHL